MADTKSPKAATPATEETKTDQTTTPAALKSEDAVKADAAKAEDNAKAETPKLSEAEIQQRYEKLDGVMRAMVDVARTMVAEHNKNVAKVRSASEKDPLKMLSEIRESNPENDPKLTGLNERITKLTEQLEKLISEANEIAKNYMPESMTPEKINALRDTINESSGKIKAQIQSMETMEEALRGMPGYENLLLVPLVPAAESLRGVRRIGDNPAAKKNDDAFRPRFSDILVNHESIKREVVNAKTKEKSLKATTTFLSEEMISRTQDKKYTTGYLTQLYVEALEAAGRSKTNEGDSLDWVIEHKFTDKNGNEQTIPFKIHTVK